MTCNHRIYINNGLSTTSYACFGLLFAVFYYLKITTYFQNVLFLLFICGVTINYGITEIFSIITDLKLYYSGMFISCVTLGLASSELCEEKNIKLQTECP